MAPSSSPLTRATNSLNRLVKEEASYHKEVEHQQARIVKAQQDTGDENYEYVLKQERKALEESQAMIPVLRTKIEDALSNLDRELGTQNKQSSPEDIDKAKAAAAAARATLAKSS